MPYARSQQRLRCVLAGGVYLALTAMLLWRLGYRAGPFVFADEAAYGVLAQNLGRGEGLTFEGLPLTQYKTIYPFVAAPFWALFDGETAYRAAILFGGAAMSAAFFPALWIARRVTEFGWALAAAAASVLIPAMVWSGMLMTEALAYPLAALALAATVAAIEAPSTRRAVLMLAAIVLAASARSQLLLLALVALAAIGIDLLAAPDRRARVRAHRVALAGLGAGALGVAVLFAAGQRGVLLGTYSGEVSRAFDLGDFLGYLPRYFGVLLVATLILPLVATVLLALRRESHREPGLAPVLAVALAASGVLILVGAWSTATISPELRERYVFYAMPAVAACWPALIGRVRPLALAGAGALAALYLIPVWARIAGNSGDEWAQYTVSSTLVRVFAPGEIGDPQSGPWWDPLTWDVQLTAVAAAGVCGLAALGLAAGVARQAAGLAFVAPVLLLGTVMLYVREVDAEAVSRQVADRYPPPGWVDEHARGRPVAFVRTGGSESRDMWWLELHNESLDRQWRVVPGTDEYNGIGQACILFVRPGGRLVPREPECAGEPFPRLLLFKDDAAEVGLRGGRLVAAGDGGTRLWEAPARGPARLTRVPHR